MRAPTLLLVAAFLPVAAIAGTESVSAPAKEIVAPCPPDPLDTIIATTDYGFHQHVTGGGSIEVEHNNFEFGRRIPLDFLNWPNVQCGKWFFRIGADYERFDFSLHGEPQLPDTLQSAAGVFALEYLVNDQTAFLLETRPGVYFQHRVNSSSFDSPTNLAMVFPFFHSDKFYVVAGVTYSGLAFYPVLPIGGVLWHISDKWDLRAYLPDPRLVYQASDNLEFYAGAELNGGAYRTDDRVVTPGKLSGAAVTFEQVRAGAGITWKAKPFTFDLAGGYTVQSEFDINRAHEHYNARPAPYIRLTARVDF